MLPFRPLAITASLALLALSTVSAISATAAPAPEKGKKNAPTQVRPASPGKSGDMDHGHDHGGKGMAEMHRAMRGGRTEYAIAQLMPASGSSVAGTVRFHRDSTGVRVTADLQGLAPGEHGIHVHEFGDCRDSAAKAAGDHFNPLGAAHGAPGGQAHHAGDLGNIQADAQGRAKLDRMFPMIVLDGPNAVIGRAVVVHAKADDLKSQPAGNSGDRIACGVIGISKD